MFSIQKTQKELLEIAKSTTDVTLLENLAYEVDSMVRRAVARNTNSSAKTLANLLKDPVLNVSYMASLNPNCTANKNFTDISHPCVGCDKDERTMICTNCQRLLSYSVAS